MSGLWGEFFLFCLSISLFMYLLGKEGNLNQGLWHSSSHNILSLTPLASCQKHNGFFIITSYLISSLLAELSVNYR